MHDHRIRSLASWAGVLVLGLIAAPRPAAAAPCTGDRSGSGFATFYHYTAGTGACSFAGDDDGPYVAAINATDYAGSRMCGAWLQVTGPLGSVDVRIVDMCPGCASGDLDLDAGAFAAIASPVAGRVPIAWRTIPDPAEHLLFLQLSAASNLYFLQIQPRHGRYAVGGLEYLGPSGYVSARRESYNYFTVDGSLVPGPLSGLFTVRVTDVNGQQVVASGIPLSPNHIHPTNQFPVCDPLAVPALDTQHETALRSPAPNPFRRSTLLAFDLARAGDVLLRLYDAGGRRVRTLVDEHLAAGRHEIAWEGDDDAGRRLAAGIYFCRLSSGAAADQKRITLTD